MLSRKKKDVRPDIVVYNKPDYLERPKPEMNRTTLLYVIGMLLGAALFVLAGYYINLPIGFAGLRIPFEYGILAAFAALLGPFPGMLMGFAATLLLGIFRGQLWWSEVVSSMFMGTIVGFCQRGLAIGNGGFEPRRLISFAGFTAGACLVCWALLCPALDMMLYGLDMGTVFLPWAVYGAAILVTSVIAGGLLCLGMGLVCRKKPLW